MLISFVLFAAGVNAAAPVAIDPQAHYPEGPVWRDGSLYFVEYSDGNIKRWDGHDSKVIWHGEKCGASGLADFHGHWLIACYDSNSLLEIDATGRQVSDVRADAKGRPFIGPNDFTADGHGGLYVSASGVYDVNAPIEGKVLHLSADGRRIDVVADTIHYPNGLTLSRDGRHLLVAEMLAGRILSFDVGPGGTLGTRRVWARLSELAPPTPGQDAFNGPDGLKLGPDGHYYIAQNGSGRVLVVGEDKKLVRSIVVPTPFVTNVAFGAPGSGEVFITGLSDQFKAPFPGAVYRWKP
jgi:gluconolactonase